MNLTCQLSTASCLQYRKLNQASNYQKSKVELRRDLIKTRRSLSVGEWREKSDRICTLLQSSPLFTQARTILAYFSFRQEPDLNPLFASTTHRWGFPRCISESLYWHSWTPEEPLIPNAYGIKEPSPQAPIINSVEVDLILVPSIACDYQGYRLGYGGGYYDRLLSSPEWSNKSTIGVIFDFAYVPQLPIEIWDQPLQGVITETQLTLTRNSTQII